MVLGSGDIFRIRRSENIFLETAKKLLMKQI